MKRIIVFLLCLIGMMALLTGCMDGPDNTTYRQQIEENEQNARAIIEQYDSPQLSRSLDYENVKRRLEYLNQGNNIGYLYLMSDTGMVIEEIQVLGKVTSLNTYITPMEEAQYARVKANTGYFSDMIVVQAPDADGTYGENVNGIFWFTPDGVYGEWPGLYRFSSERLTFQSQPILIHND